MMGLWITCLCGALIHTNLFAGAPVYQLISDVDYDVLDDPIDRDKLEALFFKRGIPVYRCKACNRLVVQWDKESDYQFYAPEGKRAENPTTESVATQADQDDDQRLKDLEAMAEAEYDEMYDARYPTGAYSRAKETFYAAIALAEKLGRQDEAERLKKRLQHVKEVFRHQFT
jgi:hypothetical protein